jgi:paraquat-inducible protein B
MSRASSPTLIGAFVVGAVTLVATAVAIFGGSELLASKTVVVTYFDGSAKGLRQGSNVAFKGVRVGFVRDIALVTALEELSPKIEVTMELVPDSIRVVEDGTPVDKPLPQVVSIERLVEAGLTAQLGSESFVTGQLLVELDFRPEAQGHLYGGSTQYPEIPSVPSDIQQAIARFQNLIADIEQNVDLAALSERLFSVLQGLDELANSPQLRSTIAGLDTLINAEDTQDLPARVSDLMRELTGTANQTRALIDRIDADVEDVSADLREAAQGLSSTLASAGRVMAALERHASGDTEEMYQLQDTLRELEDAARSMREFFDYVERHPEAFIRGRRQ